MSDLIKSEARIVGDKLVVALYVDLRNLRALSAGLVEGVRVVDAAALSGSLVEVMASTGKRDEVAVAAEGFFEAAINAAWKGGKPGMQERDIRRGMLAGDALGGGF